MGRPPHADGQKTRQAILDAALRLFADKGYFGTSLRDIASAVGVRESALYNYFSGKEALFNALLDAVHEQRAERLSPVLDDTDVDARVVLERLTTIVLDDFCAPKAQEFFRVLMSDGMRLAREGRINLLDRMTSGATPLHILMRRLVARGSLRRQRPEHLVLEFMGPLLMWRHWHALDAGSPLVANRRAFVRNHVAHFLRGAGQPGSAASRSAAPDHRTRAIASPARRRIPAAAARRTPASR